jgi:hypothetical protein
MNAFSEYKSAFGIRIYDYFSVLWVVAFTCIPLSVIVTGIYNVGEVENIPLAVIAGAVVVSLILPVIIVLLFYNITIRVTDEAVLFVRWCKAYRRLPFKKYEFTGRVEQGSYLFVVRFTARCLCAINKETGKKRDYICNSFSEATFNTLLTDITRRVHTRGAALDEYYGQSEAVEIPVSRKKALKPYKQTMFWGSSPVSFTLFCLWAFTAMVGDAPLSDFKTAYTVFAVILLVMLGIYVPLTVIPFVRALKTTPSLITVCPDRIVIDGNRFYFADMRGLRITPVNYEDRKTVRELIIEDRIDTFRFTLGSNSAIGTGISTEDYVFLHNRLAAFKTADSEPRKRFWF